MARRFDRSASEQQHVREGKIAAHVAMKYLVPAARLRLEDCPRMAAAFAAHRHNSRQAGQLYAAWRDASPAVRERILAEPDLFLKAQRQVVESSSSASTLLRDLEMALAIVTRADRRITHELGPA